MLSVDDVNFSKLDALLSQHPPISYQSQMHHQTYVQYASSPAISIYYKTLKLVLLQLLASRLQSQRHLQSSKVPSSRQSPIISGSHLAEMTSFALSNRKDELANLPESPLTARRNGITWQVTILPPRHRMCLPRHPRTLHPLVLSRPHTRHRHW